MLVTGVFKGFVLDPVANRVALKIQPQTPYWPNVNSTLPPLRFFTRLVAPSKKSSPVGCIYATASTKLAKDLSNVHVGATIRADVRQLNPQRNVSMPGCLAKVGCFLLDGFETLYKR